MIDPIEALHRVAAPLEADAVDVLFAAGTVLRDDIADCTRLDDLTDAKKTLREARERIDLRIAEIDARLVSLTTVPLRVVA